VGEGWTLWLGGLGFGFVGLELAIVGSGLEFRD